MTIPIFLNDKEIILDADPKESLLHVLQERDQIDVKCGCNEGRCGACSVLLNDRIVSSCLVSVGMLKGSRIITYGHFFLSDDYTDIKKAFDSEQLHLCGFCNARVAFTAYEALKLLLPPYEVSINELLKGYTPCCIDSYSLQAAIVKAVRYHKERLSNNYRLRS